MSSTNFINTSVQADEKPICAAQDRFEAEVRRLARRPSYAMRRRQLVYELGSLEAAEEVIRREEMIHQETANNGSATNHNGHIAQASPLARSVPPTGTRRARILEGLRIHASSVGRQIGPVALRDFVEEIIRQDIPDQIFIES
jgi:hypothetical protein